MDKAKKVSNILKLTNGQALDFREKLLVRLVLKAALKKKKRLKDTVLKESNILMGQNMN